MRMQQRGSPAGACTASTDGQSIRLSSWPDRRPEMDVTKGPAAIRSPSSLPSRMLRDQQQRLSTLRTRLAGSTTSPFSSSRCWKPELARCSDGCHGSWSGTRRRFTSEGASARGFIEGRALSAMQAIAHAVAQAAVETNRRSSDIFGGGGRIGRTAADVAT
jgi:hypothetical protein